MKEYTQIIAVDPTFQYVLLLKRSNPPGEGLLSGVGGTVEDDETPDECAVREWLEETTIPLEVPLVHLFTITNNECINHVYGVKLPKIDIYFSRCFEEGILGWRHILGMNLNDCNNRQVAWNGLIPYTLNLMREGGVFAA